MTTKKILIIGPGYIGWSVLDLLIASGHSVTGLVRRGTHASQIRASGATAILGDLHDSNLITRLVSEHDTTIHTATADDLPSVLAVLEGLRLRARAGHQSTYLHTSGTGILDDNAAGSFAGEKVYSDRERDPIDAIPASNPHRDVDTAIVAAAAEPELRQAKIAIILPPTIYGVNPKHQRLSIQIPVLTRFALKHGFSAHVGEGKSVESQIHVLDLARGYEVILRWMESATGDDVRANPFFFCENGVEASWKEVAAEIAKGLVDAGKIKDLEPKTAPESLYGDLFGDATVCTIGLNSRSRADRLRALGWAPREKGWKEAFVEDELPLLLAEAART